MPVLKNSKHERFAQFVAKGDNKTSAYVSAGYSESGASASACRLLGNAKIAARIAELQATIAERLTTKSIALKEARVQAQNDRWLKLQQIAKERGEYDDNGLQATPGWKTGLLVRHFKQIGRGEDAQVIEEFEVDAALLRELREHEMLSAKELGQWSEKIDLTGSDLDAAIERELARVATTGEAANAGAAEGANAEADPVAASTRPPVAGLQ